MSIGTGIRDRILRGEAPDPSGLAQVVETEAVRLGSAGADLARSELAADLLGAGPLEPHLADASVTDVLVNGDGAIWVDRGRGLERVADTQPRSERRRDGSRCDWLARRGGGSTRASRGWTGCFRAAFACTPCCRLSWTGEPT